MFKVVLLEHGYASIECERSIITQAGGEFVDAENLPLADAWQQCADADAILCRRLIVTAQMMAGFRRCKTIVRYGIGTDNIDVAAATAAGIIVGHVPDYCLDEVSAHAVALLLACTRRIVSTHQKLELGQWDVHRHDPISRMAGRTLGLVGLGKIGQAVARKMAGWDLRLLAADPYVEPSVPGPLGVQLVDLETLCRASDYISLHVPLLPETHHLINARTLALMKPDVIVINTARGPVIDLFALRDALDQRPLAQAGLDVFESEPLPPDSPLLRHPRVTVSDHTAWYSEESQAQLQRSAAEETVRICRGEFPLSLANPEVLRKLGRWNEWIPPVSMRWQLRYLEQKKSAVL